MTMSDIDNLMNGLINPLVYVFLAAGGAKTPLACEGNPFFFSTFQTNVFCISTRRVTT
jgi:hypothetical protein